jgi:DNA-binding CsgD family transcriptional regulator
VSEDEIFNTAEPWRHEGQLTAAELEVVLHLSHGLTRKMVGEVLGKTEETVKTQVTTARNALRAKNIPHLVAIALRQGLID